MNRFHDVVTVWDEKVLEDRVHASVYTDAQIFKEEMSKVFGGTWVFLGHESEIPEPNQYKKTYLGLREVILTRDRNNEFHALFNRCMHRGASVCQDSCGKASTFRCEYHGWTYTNSGELVGVPFHETYGNRFQKSEFNLAKVPRVDQYRGFIFGTMNMQAPELDAFLGEAKQYLDAFIDRSPTGELIVRSGTNRMLYKGNWKLSFDNASDGYHPSFSHRSLLMMTQKRYGGGKSLSHFGQNPDQGPMYVQDLGNGHGFLDQRPIIADNLWERVRPMPGREAFVQFMNEKYGEEKTSKYLEFAPGAGMNLAIFPNLLIIGNQLQVVRPIALDRTELSWYATTLGGVPDEINEIRMRIAEDFPGFGEPDDLENFERCQRGLEIEEIEWVHYGRGLGSGLQKEENGVVTAPVTDEAPIRGFYQEWKRLMKSNSKLTTTN